MTASTPQLVTLTPQMARDLLAINSHNRPMRDGQVETLAGAIRRGEWKLTHQGIAIDENGVILDGQHRLAAVVRADQPVTMYLTRDVPRETMSVIDIGARRSVGDTLSLAGYTYGSSLAVAVRTIKAYRSDNWRARYTGQQVLDFLEEEPETGKYLTAAANLGLLGTHGAISGLLYMSANGYPDMTPWIDGIRTGAGLENGDPRLMFRNAIVARRTRGIRIEPRWFAGIYAKSWRAYVEGRSIKSLQFRDTEPLPVIELVPVSAPK